MHNTAVRDRITKQFRDAAAAVEAVANQQDEANSSPMKGGLPMDGGTSEYAPRPPAGASRAAGGGTGTVPGTAPAGRGPVKSHAPVPVLPPHARAAAGDDQWPLRDFLELGALPSAVPCARLHARLVVQEWGLSTLADNVELVVSELITNALHASRATRTGAFRAAVAARRCRAGADPGLGCQSVCTDPPGRSRIRRGRPGAAAGGGGQFSVGHQRQLWGWQVGVGAHNNAVTLPSAPPGVVSARTASRAERWFVAVDGNRLRQLRRQQQLSQEELASRAGISAGTVGQLERQDRPVCRGRTLARLAAALGTQPAALMPAIDAPPGVAGARVRESAAQNGSRCH